MTKRHDTSAMNTLKTARGFRLRILTTCFLLLALAGCSALKKLPLISPAALEPCPGLTVGVLIGADGDPIAAEQRDGYELALEQANADGGPAGCQLSLVYLPEVASGSPNQVYKAVRSLVEEEHVVAILGGTSSTASMFAAALVNRFSVPMLIPTSSGVHILPENNHWSFRVGASDPMYSQAVFDMINKEMGDGKTVGLVFENSTAGHDAAVTAAQTATEMEVELIQYGALDTGAAGYTSVYEKLYENPPDVLYLIFSSAEQPLGLLRTIAEHGDDLPLTIVQGGGFINRSFFEQAGKDLPALTDNMLAATSWVAQDETVEGSAFLADFTQFTTRKYGSPRMPSPHSAMAYNSLRILQLAIRNGSAAWNGATVADIAAARESLRADLQSYRENTPAWGSIAFSTGGQNQATVYLKKVSGISSALLPTEQAARQVAMP